MPPNPIITVNLIIDEKRGRARRALRSILAQDIADQIVIYVYDRSSEGSADFPELTAPNVIYEHVGKNTTLGQLQKRAVLAATTDCIGFLEEHVVAPPEWLRESLRLHDQGYAGVSGSFLSGNSQHPSARLAFALTYGDYVLPKATGETLAIPGDNSTFIRSKLLRYNENLELLLNNDCLLIRRLLADGEKICRGNFIFHHWNESTWAGSWTGLRYWHQMYICNQIVVENWSRSHRLLRLCAIPLVPFVRTFKNFQRAKENAEDMKEFAAHVPAALMLHSGSAAGMAAGLLFGLRESEYRFADCETAAERLD